jgi:hypothetical protein
VRSWLLAAKAAKPGREQLTLIRIFKELRGRGYDGGYDALGVYMEMVKSIKGAVSDVTLAVLHDIRTATLI